MGSRIWSPRGKPAKRAVHGRKPTGAAPDRGARRPEHIAFIAGGFPSSCHPARGIFVKRLVDAVAEEGPRCTVINPWAFHEWILEWRRERLNQPLEPGRGVRKLRPVAPSFSNRQIGGWNSFQLTQCAFEAAVWRGLESLEEPPDLLYGHFLYSSGAAAVQAGRRMGRPAFVAVGEGTLWSVRPLGLEAARRAFRGVTGAIAVSSPVRRRLVEELGFKDDAVRVFPNGVDLTHFRPRDRAEMRAKYGLSTEAFLAVFVGNFLESKGVLRFAAAIDGLPGVQGVFVGSGPSLPRIPNVAFCRYATRDEVPELLSAADCFVLPSDAEGSSNATLEALACGLPVIVAEGEYFDDIVNTEVALRVPAMGTMELRAAILSLRSDRRKRFEMSLAARAHALQFDLQVRARGILEWMRARVASESSQ